MQDITFHDGFLLSSGSCDMILGVQWLQPLGDIKLDFQKLILVFCYQGREVEFQGTRERTRIVEARKLDKFAQNGCQLFMIRVLPVDQSGQEEQQDTALPIMALTQEFKSLIQDPKEFKFASGRALFGGSAFYQEFFHIQGSNPRFQIKKRTIPSKLPFHRGVFDRKIPLQQGSNPVNARCYRYSSGQKDIIEQLVQEMLDQGIMQPSSSAYASPVVLIGKKDGSWRLCVDYKALNKMTITDKFPITTMEELLDELGSSQIYSKLNLRSGYHQIRMSRDDVQKTAFKTHAGHYEYLVIPFGLTNAPSSFQRLMNHVFSRII